MGSPAGAVPTAVVPAAAALCLLALLAVNVTPALAFEVDEGGA